MNNVSWFIYLADIVGGLQVLFGFVGTIGLLISLIAFCISFIYDTDRVYRNYHDPESEDYYTITYPLEKIRPWTVFGVVVTLIWMLLAICIPSKETRYLIAASQLGEQIIQLEEVQQIGGEIGGLAKGTIELLRQQIQEQLGEAQPLASPVEAPKPD